MKHLILVMLFVFVIAGCSQNEELQIPESCDNCIEEVSFKRSLEEAKRCALKAVGEFYGMSRSINATIDNVVCITRGGESRYSESDTSYYIVNFADDGGYVLIAADRQVEPVLAITEKGSIQDLDRVSNPGAKILLANARGVKLERDSNLIPYIPIKKHKEETSVSVFEVKPRANLKWGQSWPEGLYCPNKVAGCSNTAAALAMSYFELPKSIRLTFSKGETMPLDWDVIKKHTQSRYNNPMWNMDEYFNDYCGGDYDAHNMLANLCRELGNRSGSTYSSDGENSSTSTKDYKTRDVLKNILYELNVGNWKEGMPDATNLIKNGIILTCAEGKMYDANGGERDAAHMFVVDGYYVRRETTYYYEMAELDLDWTLIRTTTSTTKYNHINWGWRGYDNGYYYMGLFRSSARETYYIDVDDVDPKGSSDFEYNRNFRYLTIYPK